MAETTPTRSLHRKLAQVMYEVERIPKRGRAPAAMGGFEFVQVGDAADVIRKALAENGVTMIPTAIELISESESETASKKLMTTVTVRTTWTVTDGDSDESITIQSMGSGADMGDKAIPKAQSNAMKYALLMGFLLSTGDDPELSDSSDRQRRAAAPGRPGSDGPPAPGGGGTEPVREPVKSTEPTLIGPYSGAGEIIVRKTGVADGNLRQDPDGPYFIVAFRAEDQLIPQMLVRGALAADVIDAAGGDLNGMLAEVSGDLYSVPFSRGDFDRPFQRLVLAHIRTAGWTLPEPAAAEVQPSGSPSPEEDAELDGALDGALVLPLGKS